MLQLSTHDGPTGGRAGRWLLLATAILQAASPLLIGFRSDTADPPIVPPGPFFAVWGVVLLGCLAAAVWGLPARRATAAPYRLVQVPLSLVQLGFVGWLAAASFAVWLTVPIFVAMLAGLVVSLWRARTATRRAERTTRVLLGGVLGVYAGWSTAAVWINIATLLPDRVLTGSGGVVLQCAFVAAAAVAAAAGAYAFRGQASYTLTTAWALAGVTVSSVMSGLPLLTVSAVTGLLVVAAVALLRRRGRRVADLA